MHDSSFHIIQYDRLGGLLRSDALLTGQTFFRVVETLVLLVLAVFGLRFVDLFDELARGHLGKIHGTPPEKFDVALF